MEHKGRTALVTGATGGIGVAESAALASTGADVLMLDIKGEEVIDNIRQDLPSGSGKLRFVTCDLTNPQAAQDLVKGLDKEVGGIDILVNNAAINP